jgi:uncharacterized protein YbjT (DUF2867 family)
VGRHVVDVLREQGHEVVPMSRSQGVDVITGEGLDKALVGVDAIIDTATGPSSEQQAATDFFTSAARNLQEKGHAGGVRAMVVVSIIGIDRLTAGYNAAKLAHEEVALAGPIPAKILRASQFHEFVGQLVEWGTKGDTAFVPKMRTQLVAARTVAEELVAVATGAGDAREVAGPREENLAAMARLLVDKRGGPATIVEVVDPANPDGAKVADGALLPGPGAVLAGPTFAEWLDEKAT